MSDVPDNVHYFAYWDEPARVRTLRVPGGLVRASLPRSLLLDSRVGGRRQPSSYDPSYALEIVSDGPVTPKTVVRRHPLSYGERFVSDMSHIGYSGQLCFDLDAQRAKVAHGVPHAFWFSKFKKLPKWLRQHIASESKEVAQWQPSQVKWEYWQSAGGRLERTLRDVVTLDEWHKGVVQTAGLNRDRPLYLRKAD